MISGSSRESTQRSCIQISPGSESSPYHQPQTSKVCGAAAVIDAQSLGPRGRNTPHGSPSRTRDPVDKRPSEVRRRGEIRRRFEECVSMHHYPHSAQHIKNSECPTIEMRLKCYEAVFSSNAQSSQTIIRIPFRTRQPVIVNSFENEL